MIETNDLRYEVTNSQPKIAFKRIGNGPPVIFLHGIGGHSMNWAHQQTELADSFSTIAWDARGYGNSGDPEGAREFSVFAGDLRRLLDELNIERAHFVGLSMGARILMDFYPGNKHRVATLTLCDCFSGFQSKLSPDKQREFLELREKPLKEGKTFSDLAPALIDSLVSPSCSAEAREALRRSIVALRPESYLKTLRASVTFDRSTDIANISVPVQLIFGSDDRLTPPSMGEQMLEVLPNAQLAVIPGAGHLSNLEQPARFDAVLGDFLAEHTTRARFL